MSEEQYYEEIVNVPIDNKKKCDPYCPMSLCVSCTSLICILIVLCIIYSIQYQTK